MNIVALIKKLWQSITQGLYESSHSQELAAAQARIKDLEGQVDTLNANQAATDKLLAAAQAAIALKDADIATHVKAITDLNSQIEGLITANEKLKSQVAGFEAEKAALAGQSDFDALHSTNL